MRHARATAARTARAPGGCLGMRHARATAVQSSIGDAIVHIAGKRFRELPFNTIRPELGMSFETGTTAHTATRGPRTRYAIAS